MRSDGIDQRRALPRLRRAWRPARRGSATRAAPTTAPSGPSRPSSPATCWRAAPCRPTERCPRNLLALMGTSIPVQRYEAVTDLCPPGRLRAAGRQAAQHRPGRLARRVRAPRAPARAAAGPGADRWRLGRLRGRGGRRRRGTRRPRQSEARRRSDDPLARWHGSELSRAQRADPGRPASCEQGLARSTRDPGSHFIHVVAPACPWFFTPWGTSLMRPMPQWDDADHGDDPEWSSLIRYQRHSLQTGAADVALGQVLDQLRRPASGTTRRCWSTADHGTSTIPPDVGREATENNAEEVSACPSSSRPPASESGTVVDDVAMTIDVLPTLMDLLDIETDWEMDGPLAARRERADGRAARRPGRRRPVRGRGPPRGRLPARVGLDGAGRRRAAGRRRRWWDTRWPTSTVGEPSGCAGRRTTRRRSRRCPTTTGEVPQLMTGRDRGLRRASRRRSCIVANGTVAGVTGGYDPATAAGRFSSMLGPYLVRRRQRDRGLRGHPGRGPSRAPPARVRRGMRRWSDS